MQRLMLTMALFWWSSSPALAAPPHPLGRTEVMPLFGAITFDRKFSLRPALFYGGEIAHTFLLDHPLVTTGTYTRVYGAQTAFLGTDNKVDVINGSAGLWFGYRGLGRLVPYVGAGAGFLFADATPSGFEVRGRITYEAKVGTRVYPLDWLVVKGEVGMLFHDNLPLGAGSGQLGTDLHLFPHLGIGVVR